MRITPQAQHRAQQLTTPARVLAAAGAVLLLGVVTAAVQQDGGSPDESVVRASPTPTRSVAPAPTRPPATTPTRPPAATPSAPASPATVPPRPSAPTTPPVVPPAPTTPPVSPTQAPPSEEPFEPGPPTSGTTTLDGVRLEVEVDRSQVEAGDVVRVTTTVTNTRTTPVVYRTRCGNQVAVRAATGANAMPSVGWAGDRQTFKDLALANLVGAGNAFVPAAQLDSGRTAACPSPNQLVDLAPMRTIVEQHAWRAATAYGSGYDGQAPVTSGFEFALERGLPGDPAGPEFSTVEASAPLRLVGEGTGVVPPTVAVDAALRLPQFASFVEQGDSAVWEPPYPAGSDLGATVSLDREERPTYSVQLVRPDAMIVVRVLADTGTPTRVTVE